VLAADRTGADAAWAAAHPQDHDAGAGTAPKLMDERMGHEDGSVQSRYDHITAGMRQALMVALTEMWEESLNARLTMSPGSPVAVLDALLKARQ
jgi:hypothetical protein